MQDKAKTPATAHANQRDHLNLQIDLLAEKEITKMLQMQRLLCERFGLHGGCRLARVS